MSKYRKVICEYASAVFFKDDELMSGDDVLKELNEAANPQPVSPSDSSGWLSCPFCGITPKCDKNPVDCTRTTDKVYHQGGNNCILGGMWLNAKKWQNRAT